MTTLYPIQQPLNIPSTSGIYKITCLTTGKFYVGSATNLRDRWRHHLSELRNKTHHNIILQRAFDKYGHDTFLFEIIELVLVPFLIEREQYWIDTLNPPININPIAGSCLGREISPETREKIRQANLGKKQSPESIEKMLQSRTSFKHSPETRAKIGDANRFRKQHPNQQASKMKTLIVTDPNGNEYTITGINRFCREHCLVASCMIAVAKGKLPHHKKWKARYPD